MWWLIALLAAPAWAQPDPPATPPAAVTTSSLPPTLGVAQGYTLRSGWNTISFPFRKVVASRGLDALIDPNNSQVVAPTDAQPGHGYWVFAAESREAVAWGEPQETSCTLSLEPGWNLVGSPIYDPLALHQVTASNDTEFNRVWEEVTPSWLDARMITAGQKVALGPEARWEPGAAYWLFAHRALRLRVSAASEIPQVVRLYQNEAGEQIIEGEHFGPPDSGRLVSGNQSVPESSILEWTPTRIRLRAPAYGPITVVSGAASSPRLVPHSSLGPRRAGYSLKVLAEDGLPVNRASVYLDGLYCGLTDRWGIAPLNPAEGGIHRLRITRSDFLSRDLNWNPERTATPQATLYSPRSSIWIRATPCAGGFRPYKIEIYQKTDYTRRYYNTWYYSQATPYVDLIWNSVPTNLVYRIDLYWRDANGLEKYLQTEYTLGRYGLQKTFYNFWGPPW